jgi:2-polyprenyl-3-methyl-5-hydroxy-6-metoxy-1,4-benzoquinol methylase
MAHGVCPFWVGYFLVCPLRRLYQNPRKLLEPYVRGGVKVLDVGCAMGFFSLPLAEIVGDGGMVVCIDIQEKMIHKLEKRALKAGLSERIRTRIARDKSLCLDDLKEQIDFALAFAVVHEVPDAEIFFSEIFKTLKPSGTFLIAEPGGHVTEEVFEKTVSIAKKIGFRQISRPQIRASRTVLLEK